MNLEQAIKHAREQAEKLKGTPCGEQHAQLAGWLSELLAVREAQPVIGDCDPEVYENGKSLCLVDVPKHTAENICRSISEATGFRIDWHYIGGRVHIKALAPLAAATISPTTPGEVLDRAILKASISWPLSAEQIKRLYTQIQQEIES